MEDVRMGGLEDWRTVGGREDGRKGGRADGRMRGWVDGRTKVLPGGIPGWLSAATLPDPPDPHPDSQSSDTRL